MSTYADDLAFPSSSNLLGETVQHPGMSLRDYFAAKAMQAELGDGVALSDIPVVAKRAYIVADAMLEKRK
jgi:hypothetical protein